MKAINRILTALAFAAAILPASAAEMYYNRLSKGAEIIPAGTYGDIVVPEGGYKATQFPSALSTITQADGDWGGAYTNIIADFNGKIDLANHTVSGWFKVSTKTSGDTTLLVEKTSHTGLSHRGNAIKASADGKLVVGKVNSSDGWQDNGSHITSTGTLPTNEWFYLTVNFTVSHGSKAATRIATAKAYTNGVEFAMPMTSFQCNYNGTNCAALKVGDGVACAGLRVDDTAVTDPATMKAWAVDPKYVVSPSGESVATAHWTGAAQDDDLGNYENWACTNFLGNVVEEGVPGESTTVYFTGTNISVQIEGEVDWAAVSVNGKLGAKCNWSGLKATTIVAGSVLDLNGQEFSTAGFTSGGIFMVTNSAEGVATFAVDIPEETTHENACVRLLGNLKLVKQGAGTYVGKVQDQTYTGGTVIEEGIATTVAAKSSDDTAYAESKHFYGATGSTMTVCGGAVLDIAGNYDWYVHDIVLDGGVIRNSGTHQIKYTWSGLGNVTLTADSKMSLKCHTLFKSDGAGLNLGGHTLTVERTGVTDNILCSFSGTYTVTGGNIISEQGIRLNTRQAGVILRDVNLTVNGSWIHNATTFSVVDLAENLTSAEGVGVAEVSGVFRTNGKFDNVRLVDGATLDLTDSAEAFSTTSALGNNYALTFGENAMVTVDLTGRTVEEGDKIIAWTAQPPATARILAKGADVYFVRRDDGLYAAKSIMIFVR